MSTVLITGNPVDGFAFRGPFADRVAAIKYAEWNHEGGDWWVADMLPDDSVTLAALDQGAA